MSKLKKVNILYYFRSVKYPNLEDLFKQENTLLLFPGDDAIDVGELPPLADGTSYNLVVLDGTWSQARGMYANNKLLKFPKKVLVLMNI